jgi:hypothetical protein
MNSRELTKLITDYGDWKWEEGYADGRRWVGTSECCEKATKLLIQIKGALPYEQDRKDHCVRQG